MNDTLAELAACVLFVLCIFLVLVIGAVVTCS